MREIRLGSFLISDESPPYVIAEIGNNHQGKVDICIKMIEAAQKAGASAVKLQKRNNKKLFTREFYNSPYNSENAFGETYGEHRENLELSNKDFILVKEYSKDLGIDFFATAFDEDSADFLAEIDVPIIKIASADLRSTHLLKHCAKLKKPLIISTGAATLNDVIRAYELLKQEKADFAILQCTSEYPADYSRINLNVIASYKKEFPDTVIGISSHDNGIMVPVAAYMLGARVIEKHFTLDRSMKGTDHAFSLEPQGLTKLVRDLKRLHLALGSGEKNIYETELAPLLKMSKKIVSAAFIPKGTMLTENHVNMKTSNSGLWPYELEKIIGQKTARDIDADEPITESDLVN